MKKRKFDENIESTREAVALRTGIPIEHVATFKKLGCKAASTTGRYYIKEIQDWYEANKAVVIEFLENKKDDSGNSSTWKERTERATALIKEIELSERQGKTLNKDEAFQTVKTISSAQSIVFRNLAQELPHKLLGKGLTDMQVILTNVFKDISILFQQPLDKWEPKPESKESQQINGE